MHTFEKFEIAKIGWIFNATWFLKQVLSWKPTTLLKPSILVNPRYGHVPCVQPRPTCHDPMPLFQHAPKYWCNSMTLCYCPHTSTPHQDHSPPSLVIHGFAPHVLLFILVLPFIPQFKFIELIFYISIIKIKGYWINIYLNCWLIKSLDSLYSHQTKKKMLSWINCTTNQETVKN